MYNGRKVIAVVVAAGSGSRMGLSLPKQFLKIGGVTVLERTVLKFEKNGNVDGIFVVAGREYVNHCEQIFSNSEKLIAVVEGGSERRQSVKNAIDAMRQRNFTDCLAVVHDAARPFVSQRLIDSVIAAAYEFKAAVPSLEITDTIKSEVTYEGKSFVKTTVDRQMLRAVQTPQCFDFELLYTAHENAVNLGFSGTDDSSLVEALGEPVVLVDGDEDNIKITRKKDMPVENRVGNGFDVHKFIYDRDLILGGEKIPCEKGLDGHSDADVLTHAIMDALLGAAKLGDIGRRFPDTDDAYKGISSISLLEKVGKLLQDEGYAVVNIDAVIMCEKPKLADYIQKMEENIAQGLYIEASRVNIKATTTEKLGFTGRGEGIAASAVCLLVANYK